MKKDPWSEIPLYWIGNLFLNTYVFKWRELLDYLLKIYFFLSFLHSHFSEII